MPLTKSQIESRIQQILVENLGVDEVECTPNSSLVDDLGCDSLDCVELVISLEEAFEIEIQEDDAEGLRTVGDITKYIERRTT